MKKGIISALVLTTALVAAPQMSALSAEDLREALAAAYSSNPDLAAKRAALRASDESVFQANSGFLPTVSGSASYGKSKSTGDANGVVRPEVNGTGKSYSLNANQSLFSGFQSVNARKQAEALIKAGRADLLSTEQTIFLNAVTAYVDVIKDEATLGLQNNNVQVLERQLQASKDRFEVGEITRTDVAQSEASLAAAVSQEITAEANLAASRATYRAIIGNTPGSLTQPEALPQLPASLSEAVEFALESNPAVVIARHNEKAAQYAVKQAKGGLSPTIGLRASISRDENEGGQIVGGILNNSSSNTTVKQVGIGMTVPLYTGGAKHSDIRRAKQNRSQRLLLIQSAERQVMEQVSIAWDQFRATNSSIQSIEAQVRANAIALEGVRQEAAVGSRTTLNVLDAEQKLLDSNVQLVRAKRNQYVAAYGLLASIGSLTASNMGLDVDAYDPSANTNKVRWKLFGW